MRISQMEHGAHRAAGHASSGIEILARVGYATKGVVYLLIGGLALMTVFNEGGGVGGGENAIQTIAAQPFGQILLIVTAIGLFGYALWRFVQSALDPEQEGTDGSGIAKRVGYAASGLMHAALGVLAFQMATGIGSSSGGGSQSTYIAKIMSEPFGRYLIGAIGIAFIAAGLYQAYKGYTAKFERELETSEMSQTERTWARRLGRIGYAARGVVFPIMGFFIVQAAIQYDPSQAKGLGGALSTLASQSYGMIILGVVAAGLFAYGIFQFVLAKYRRIPAHT